MCTKLVEVQVAFGENVITALGMVRLYVAPEAMNVIVEFVRVIVAPLLGMPLALKFALNQT